jgi:hypothetical protein
MASRWGKKPPLPEYIYYLPVSSRKELWRDIASGDQSTDEFEAGDGLLTPAATSNA